MMDLHRLGPTPINIRNYGVVLHWGRYARKKVKAFAEFSEKKNGRKIVIQKNVKIRECD